jgi:hypothetical protein
VRPGVRANFGTTPRNGKAQKERVEEGGETEKPQKHSRSAASRSLWWACERQQERTLSESGMGAQEMVLDRGGETCRLGGGRLGGCRPFSPNLYKSSEQRVHVGERQRFSPWESTAPTRRRLARSRTSLACLTWWLLVVRDGASRDARGRVTPVHQLPFARKKSARKREKEVVVD